MILTDEQLVRMQSWIMLEGDLSGYDSPINVEILMLELITGLREEREKVRISEEFILWLTPCGQESGPPTYELIGKSARETFAKLRGVKE